MQKLITTCLNVQILLVFLFGINAAAFPQTEGSFSRFDPIKFEENISLRGFDVLETYKLSDEDFILIAKKDPFDPEDEGLKIIHLRYNGERFKVTFASYGAGESYIYKPTFFRKGDKIIIVCEMGTEYSWGLDAFLLVEGEFIRMGNMNVAADANNENHQESAASFLEISEDADTLLFTFQNRVRLFLYPGEEEETTIQPSSLSYRYHFADGWSMEMR